MKQAMTATLVASFCCACAQHTTPNSWQLVGASQGWPQEESGRAIHAIHTPPTNLAMGNRGRIVFFGRNNPNEDDVLTHGWMPPMYLESGFGTFNWAENELDYEAFCCGQTLMEDGRVVIAGSNFGSLGQGFENVPGPQVAIYNPATNT